MKLIIASEDDPLRSTTVNPQLKPWEYGNRRVGRPRRKSATEAADLLWKQPRGTHDTADLDLTLTAHRHQIFNLAQTVSRCKQKQSHRTSTTNNFGSGWSEAPVTPTRPKRK